MESCIKGAKILIEKQVKEREISVFGEAFSKYYKPYFWTNENINDYLELVNFAGKNSALSVLASGDHAFNLITNGVSDVDTFDTNMLTEYIALGLKRAMILKFNYKDFLYHIKLMCSDCIKLEDLSDIISSLLPFMEKRMRIFWQEILDYNYKVQKELNTPLNLLKMLCLNISQYCFKEINSYLLSEECYELLKSRIGSANISFKCADAMRLTDSFSNQYDFILLSNILDYAFKTWGVNWKYHQLKEYSEKIETLTNDDGVIFLQYLLYYNPINPVLFGDALVKPGDLEDEELVGLPFDYTGVPTGVILKRKRRG